MSATPPNEPTFHFWLLDTRTLWPGDDFRTSASPHLPLVAPSERTKALAYHFPRDARTSLASSLLKRLFAHRAAHTPWSTARFARRPDPTHGKPALLSPPTPCDFNISHQAGVVVLAGAAGTADVKLGVDVTCAGERTPPTLAARGFARFVDMHAEAFSDADLTAIKGGAGGEGLREKLRRFYAFWALKEAYVKLEGEALLAPWLREVAFGGVRVPKAPAAGVRWGEVVEGVEVWVRGVRREGARMWVQAFEGDYFVATAALGVEGGWAPRWEVLGLEADVVPFASRVEEEGEA